MDHAILHGKPFGIPLVLTLYIIKSLWYEGLVSPIFSILSFSMTGRFLVNSMEQFLHFFDAFPFSVPQPPHFCSHKKNTIKNHFRTLLEYKNM
jgi:hypothetical protein